VGDLAATAQSLVCELKVGGSSLLTSHGKIPPDLMGRTFGRNCLRRNFKIYVQWQT